MSYLKSCVIQTGGSYTGTLWYNRVIRRTLRQLDTNDSPSNPVVGTLRAQFIWKNNQCPSVSIGAGSSQLVQAEWRFVYRRHASRAGTLARPLGQQEKRTLTAASCCWAARGLPSSAEVQQWQHFVHTNNNYTPITNKPYTLSYFNSICIVYTRMKRNLLFKTFEEHI